MQPPTANPGNQPMNTGNQPYPPMQPPVPLVPPVAPAPLAPPVPLVPPTPPAPLHHLNLQQGQPQLRHLAYPQQWIQHQQQMTGAFPPLRHAQIRNAQAFQQHTSTFPPLRNAQIIHTQAFPPQIQPYQHPHFKYPIIPGIAPRTYLPQGTSLVLEGGGTRGFYSAGVFEAFMDAGIMFPYIVAVSAGAANVLTYIAGQRGRNRIIVEHLVKDPRYLNTANLLRGKSLFDYDFIFHQVPKDLLFFDQNRFNQTQTRLLTGTLDCREGRTIWYEKDALAPDYTPTIASCSIPFVSKMVRYDNRDLYDGGILDPIPIDKSVQDGNTFHVIIMTQNPGYLKQASRIGSLAWLKYHRKYPHLVWALQERHNAYNRQVQRAEQLEREGRALIIRPLDTIDVSRVEQSPDKLLALYDEGHREGTAAVAKLRQRFAF